MRGAAGAGIALAVLAAACGTPRRGVPFTGEHTPPSAEIALGQKVFAASCAQCHPGGTGGLGLAINDKPLPGWLIKLQVRTGVGAMPSFSEEEIGDRELDALAEYLIWLRRLEPRGVEPREPTDPGARR